MKTTIGFVAVMTFVASAVGDEDKARKNIFARGNLVAWCIVPFDAKNRSPKERAAMLQRLGIRYLAYDYRAKHIPSFDEEFKQMRAHKRILSAWWCGGVDPGKPLAGSVKLALDAIRRNRSSADLWVLLSTRGFDRKTQQERIAICVAAISQIAKAAAKTKSRVGLYNHGGWFGQPENQMAIVAELKKRDIRNVGIVYNFHHGHEHLDRIEKLLPRMVPNLLCLNLNGMTKGGPKILPIGSGKEDVRLIKLIRDSGYRGPIGILDHRGKLDAEKSLKENLDGLESLLKELK